VIDVGDDREVAYEVGARHGAVLSIAHAGLNRFAAASRAPSSLLLRWEALPNKYAYLWDACHWQFLHCQEAHGLEWR
jgi:hypothetical protein